MPRINSKDTGQDTVSCIFTPKCKVPEPNSITKMFKLFLLAAFIPTLIAETPSAFTLLEKHAVQPDESQPINTHAVIKKDSKPEDGHPVYRGEDQHQGRANIEPVRPKGPVIKYDPMLADQPSISLEGNRDNRIDAQTVPGYAFIPTPPELGYPDIAYAPGYGYDQSYAADKNYDVYGNNPNTYLMDPMDTSMYGLMWSQVPDSRTFISFVGKTISWVFSSIFVLLLGSLLTIGVCSYTNLCSIAFHGVGPIHEEMRSLMTPERLEKIGNAAEFVKTAIDKYQKIKKVTGTNPSRRRRAIIYE